MARSSSRGLSTPVPGRRSLPAPSTYWAQVDVGLGRTCALKANKTLWCWGQDVGNPRPSLSVRVPTQKDPSADWEQVSVNLRGACGIRSDGTLWCWGSDENFELGTGDALKLAPGPVVP